MTTSVPGQAVEPKRQPCNDYAADWRGEHEPHVWERLSGQLRQCPGRAFTREQRWDQALSGWTVFLASDGVHSLREATDEETRAECMALADFEAASALNGKDAGAYVMANANRCTVHPQHLMVDHGYSPSHAAHLFRCACGESKIGTTDEIRARCGHTSGASDV